MPILSEEDLLGSLPSDIDGIQEVGSALTGPEIYPNYANQRSVQERRRKLKLIDQGAFNDNDEIQATISADVADGHNAQLDASLKLLSEDDPKLQLPNDLEANEIHIIEATTAGPSGGNVFTGGKHALQDYQMQLMLLEQQNKKRLRLPRLQAEIPRGPSPFDEVAAAKELKRRYPTDAMGKDQAGAGHHQQPFLDRGTSLPVWPIPAAKRQKRGTGQSRKKDKFDFVNGSDSSATQVAGVPHVRHDYDLLYRISCHEDTHKGFHVALAFRDAPVVKDPLGSNSRRRFDGEVPVFDLQALMDNDTNGTAFVVIRTVKCSETSVLRAIAGGPLRWTEAIYMKSRLLREAMGSVATCYFQPTIAEDRQTNDPYYGTSNIPSGDNKSPSKRNQIDPADLFIFHHRALLKEYASKHSETSHHISALLAYALERFGAEYEKADNLFERGIVDQERILHLFKPNDVIVSGTYRKPAAFVLQDWPSLDSTDWMTLSCWSFQTDGSGFARRRDVLSISPIAAKTVNIQDLAAYPLRFAAKDMQDSIRDRGRKYWALRIATQITYKGWNVARDQFYPDARFMVDHKIYKKMHEYAKAFNFERPETTRAFDQMPAYLNVDDEPSETSFLLLPPAIHGFYLNEKKWIHLFVDDVHPVSYNTMAFERLVLPTRTKELVRALVTVRTSQRGVKQGLGVAGKRTDITSGKGNGLIMLMHGGPGTGKTLTAESVAEIAKMPLYRVTCGDVGTNTDAVEKYLNTVLYLGKTWNCVLLLDEADVFLEERSMSDLKRNSLVSVFLRVLEYYDGILILTSNRVGMFDEAFKSRIQVALHYENLNRSARKKIWKNFLDMLEEDEEDVNFGEINLRLDDLAGKELNGRQIRNVLTTARQLAIYRKERLDYDHLDQALSVSSDFSEYLKRVQGHTDDERMRDTALR